MWSGWTLQFRLGPSLLGKDVKIFCNHPEASEGEIFDRRRYRGLIWRRDGGPADDTAMYAEVTMVRAGSFHFYYTCDENKYAKIDIDLPQFAHYMNFQW